MANQDGGRNLSADCVGRFVRAWNERNPGRRIDGPVVWRPPAVVEIPRANNDKVVKAWVKRLGDKTPELFLSRREVDFDFLVVVRFHAGRERPVFHFMHRDEVENLRTPASGGTALKRGRVCGQAAWEKLERM